MACHGCATKFGFFEKEFGCPICGFAFCKKCLRYEAEDRKKQGSRRNICMKCYIKHADMEIASNAMDKHADNFKKCIETMCESDPTAKYEFNDQKNKFPTLRNAFDYETQKLVERVNKLDEEYKRNHPKVLSEEELRERLNRLEDRPSCSKDPPADYKPQVRLSETEESDQLVQQLVEEESLKKDLPKAELDIEARLARLLERAAIPTTSKEKPVKSEKGKEAFKTKSAADEDSLLLPKNKKKKGVWGLELAEELDTDEEEITVNSIVKKALLDVKMEKELQMLDYEEKERAEIEEQKQFPWCVICNENATQRCIECDGDLYCDACFNECCKPEDHLSEPFEVTKGNYDCS